MYIRIEVLDSKHQIVLIKNKKVNIYSDIEEELAEYIESDIVPIVELLVDKKVEDLSEYDDDYVQE